MDIVREDKVPGMNETLNALVRNQTSSILAACLLPHNTVCTTYVYITCMFIKLCTLIKHSSCRYWKISQCNNTKCAHAMGIHQMLAMHAVQQCAQIHLSSTICNCLLSLAFKLDTKLNTYLPHHNKGKRSQFASLLLIIIVMQPVPQLAKPRLITG